ncbi:phosphoadenylyl-sulfate reductase [Hydrotalea sp.]|uniref:phosphoadenylyl-sulfate reductase n=1 Tax=Hydrotalea sp. TaxID=2881279 RepID=UPI00260D3210|nr:phosphoadenylyl-sulfate reductase [Hydrotalea sp.]
MESINISAQLQQLQSQVQGLSEWEALQTLTTSFPGKVVFSTSFSMEDQAIAYWITKYQLAIQIFTLDTGRLFPETYSVWERTKEKYGAIITAYYPNAAHLQQFASQNGPNAFYSSVENRKQCCFIRKVEPLQKALQGNKVWITGLRAEHSPDRKDLPMLEWDSLHAIFKFHPILHWSTETVKTFIQQNDIPYNPLHDKGFVSIGCAPCTRAIQPGEDFRAGRWWWEDASKKECGLHLHQDIANK